jgi:hypothetical protein
LALTELLGVDPFELRMTSTYLADVSDRMKAVQSTLHQLLSAQGEAWGRDKIGDQFANGAQGYRSQLHWVDGSIAAKTELLDHYSNMLRLTANALEQQDSA